MRWHARCAQTIGRSGKGARGFFGDVAVGLARLVLFGVQPERAQALLHVGPGDVLQREAVALAGRAGEMGVHLDAQAVTDHQQRRAFQRQCVHHQLPQRAFQALARCLVFPGEMAAQPHVSKAVGALLAQRGRAAGLGHTALEAVGVGVGRLGHAQHAAQVDEVGLRAGAFIQFVGSSTRLPLADEILSLHRWPPWPVCCAVGRVVSCRVVSHRFHHAAPDSRHSITLWAWGTGAHTPALNWVECPRGQSDIACR